MVFIPRSGITPLLPDPMVAPFAGLAELQFGTHVFIMMEPTPISLIPVTKLQAAGGGWNVQEGSPRPSQNFRLINQGLTIDGMVSTTDGQARKFDFILLGEWNASVQIGDFFQDSENDNQFWNVNAIQPYNGYEVKAAMTSYGRKPRSG